MEVPSSAVERAGAQLLHQQRRRKVVSLQADVVFPAALKASGHVVVGISENHDHLIAHFQSHCEGMLDQRLAAALALTLRRHADRPKGYAWLLPTLAIDEPALRVHDAADDLAILFQHKGQLRDKVRVPAHRMHKVMLVAAGNILIPERLAGQVFHRAVVVRGFQSDRHFVMIHSFSLPKTVDRSTGGLCENVFANLPFTKHSP